MTRLYLYIALTLVSMMATINSYSQSTCSWLAAPTVTSITSDNASCGPVTLTYHFTTGPQSFTWWYWQKQGNDYTQAYGQGNPLQVTESGTYYLRTWNGSCWSTNTSVSKTVTVNPIPAEPNPQSTTISAETCGPKTITRVGSPTGGVLWYWQTSSTGQSTSLGSGATLPVNSSNHYYLRAQGPSGCWSTTLLDVGQVNIYNVNNPPNAPDAYICGAGSVALNVTSPQGDVRWYHTATGGSPITTSLSQGLYISGNTLTVDLTTGQSRVFYAEEYEGTCVSATRDYAAAISVSAPPAPSASAPSICNGGTTTLTASGAGDEFRWYKLPYPNGSVWKTGSSVTSETLSGAQTISYYVSAVHINGGVECEGPRTQVDAKSFLSPPTAPTASDQSKCAEDPADITLTVSNPSGSLVYKWYADAGLNTLLDSGPSFTPDPQPTASQTSYYVTQAYSASPQCESAYEEVKAILETNQTAPTHVSTTCSGNQYLLTVSGGTSYQWYTSSGAIISGETANTYTVPALDASYKVSAFNGNGCESSQITIAVDDMDLGSASYTAGTNTATVTIAGGIGPYHYNFKAYQRGNVVDQVDYFDEAGLSKSWQPTIAACYDLNIVASVSEACSNTMSDIQVVTIASDDNNPDCDILRNWTQTTTFTVDGSGQEQMLSDSKSYFDDFGKVVQSQVKHLEENNVFAGHTLYDELGNGVISTLPAPINRTDFGYIHDFITYGSGQQFTPDVIGSETPFIPKAVDQGTAGKLGHFYSDNSPEEYMATNQYPYSASWVEKGPDPRISRAGSVGELRLGSNYEVVSERFDITADELQHYFDLRHYFVDGTTLNEDLGYRSVSTDPDGNKSVIWANAAGQAVASALIESGTSNYINWSYNYYDDVGNLIATVAPKGVNQASTARPDFTTEYEYNHLGQLIKVSSPDEGISHYVYSEDGKIRFSQNAEQGSPTGGGDERFSYTLYDEDHRLIESGEYIMKDAGHFVFESHFAISHVTNSIFNIVDLNGSAGDLTGGEKKHVSNIYYDRKPANFPTNGLQEPRFLIGEVSGTANGKSKTWYSYDEYGRVEWIATEVTDLSNKLFITEYSYDFSGNLLEVAFQPGVAGEAFYHHYTYDSEGRLLTVKTSEDGVIANAKLQATYDQYMHGPLERMELGEGLQGLDFTYTEQGWLKAINHPDDGIDPGNDASNVNFYEDAFGMTLEYYQNDYQRTGTNITSVTLSDQDFPQHHTGNVRATAWGRENFMQPIPAEDDLVLSTYDANENDVIARNSIRLLPGFVVDQNNTFTAKADPDGMVLPPEEVPNLYAYKYDQKNQLTEARFGEKANFNGNEEEFKVTVPTYDDHGNIMSLTRNDEAGDVQNNFSYTYANATKNQLSDIPGHATYIYNKIGQLIETTPNGQNTQYIKYDAYGNVLGVYPTSAHVSEDAIVEYEYDDRGFRLSKKSGSFKYWYIRDASGNLLGLYLDQQQLELPIYGASRLGIAFRNVQPDHLKYNYELTDHLGNVRTVVSPIKTNVQATLETSPTEVQAFEDLVFENTDTRQQDVNYAYNGSYAARLNGYDNRIVGPAISLAVNNGDVVDMSVYAKYDNNTNNNPAAVSGLVAALTGSFGITSTGETANIYTAIDDAITGTAAFTGGSSNLPRAYLAYLLFDQTYTLKDHGHFQVTSNSEGIGANHDLLSLTANVTENGFIYIYVINESAVDVNVFFDDFSINHEGLSLIRTADYYPFGSVMRQELLNEENPYRFGYQGQFAEKDDETGLNSFELRMYDPLVGKWLSTDPFGEFWSPYLAMGNNPGLFDPTGGMTAGCCEPLKKLGLLPSGLGGSSLEILRLRYLSGITIFATRLPQLGKTLALINAVGRPINTSLSGDGTIATFEDFQVAHDIAAFDLAVTGTVIKEFVKSSVVPENHGDENHIAMSLPFPGANGPQLLRQLRNIQKTRRALELARQVGKNRVILRSEKLSFKFDLTGKAHFNKSIQRFVQTPHKHIGKLNIRAPKHIGRQFNFSKDVQLMTNEDIRLVRKYLERIHK